jgi:hypothetical protein
MRVELETFKVTDVYKFSTKDIKKVISIIEENQSKLIGAWNDYFNPKS